MSSFKFGFIGTGNMGGALARAVCKAVNTNNVILADKSSAKVSALANELNCSYGDSTEIAQQAQYIFLGVKPQVMKSALEEIAPVLRNRNDRFVLISMAAGMTIDTIKELLGFACPIIRIMPNTPVSAGKGMILYSKSDLVFMDEIGEFSGALKFAGKLDNIDENLIDAASALSGCGPAFVYLFAEAMADAGVECGLTRAKAIEYAAQTLSGAAELMLTTAKHSAVLKDEVCSPGGSTIAGVHALEENGFRAAVMDAVTAAYKKTKELGKK